MKIVFFDFVTHHGGGPQLAADTAKRLAVEHDVEVIDAYGVCKPYLKTLQDAGINAHILVPEVRRVFIGYSGHKLRRLWRILCQVPVFLRLRHGLVRQVRKLDPDVIWTNGTVALAFLGFSFRLRRYPLAIEVIRCLPAAFIRGYGKWLMKHRVASVMAISTETARQLRLAGLKEDRIHVVFDTIDIADTVERSTQALQTPLPGLDKRPRILLPATLLRAKGHHTAIRAVGHLKSQGMTPTLWLAGDAVGNDQSYPQYLRSLAKELGVSQHVHFLGWRRDLPAIMLLADIVVLPTHSEGFGHVILEAMLLRRPVVATHVGGIKDSIQDGVNGLVFPVDDDEALASQFKRLATDVRLASTLVENGYQTVTQRFTPELHTQRFTEALVCAATSARSRLTIARFPS